MLGEFPGVGGAPDAARDSGYLLMAAEVPLPYRGQEDQLWMLTSCSVVGSRRTPAPAVSGVRVQNHLSRAVLSLALPRLRQAAARANPMAPALRAPGRRPSSRR
eukprot:6076166-Pyramimonas_sp.AAC.1